MSDLKPTLKQIELYNQLRKIAEPHYMYADQIMAIAEYIDAEYMHKSKANGVETGEGQLTIPDVSGSLPISDSEYKKVTKEIYPKDNSKKFRRQ